MLPDGRPDQAGLEEAGSAGSDWIISSWTTLFDSQYRADERMEAITLDFSLLAVLIGCLGLFGMSSFTVERRTKEIGIRKVLGSSVAGIVRLLVQGNRPPHRRVQRRGLAGRLFPV